ncbi:nuclease [Hylemonella gracilis str. Niagara R]|uniref:Nuclease n=1 Tax=Hylemonella gracilis str. Niagara R TaxID=1458275 RepID=A0A016XDX8_9BURK|nr:thermonuclease family protein [Hylemonella gracilis]EYC50011.1 nuclease [Hylemonella gracilis str. Niagara R]
MRGFARLGLLALGLWAAAWSSLAIARETARPDPELAFVLQAAPVRVLAVLDGDTLEVEDRHQRRWRIRLQGVDAPELAQARRRQGQTCRTQPQPHAEAARQALADKVQGQAVRLRTEGTRSYDRVVAYVLLGRREVNREMVAEGWAWSLDRHHALPAERRSYARSQGEARAARRGLWAETREGQAPKHPARWRAEHGRC